jgi:hypothetical protein
MSFVCFPLRHAVLVSTSILLVGVGCASAGKPKLQTAASGPEQRFTMTGSGFQTSAVISKEGAQGPQIAVGRYDDGKAIRGKASGQVIDLTVSGTRAQGIWGPGPLTSTWPRRANSSR